jgi:hypothetical protein
MAALVGVGVLCLSSSAAGAAFAMNRKKEEPVAVPAEQPEETIEKEEKEEVGLPPEQPPPPPEEPKPTPNATPDSMRSASSVWDDRGLNYKLERCGDSMIDSAGGWCSKHNSVGQWIQLDNGKLSTISGIITQGRKDADQWVKSFRVKYKDQGGSWWDVDGKTFPGNSDRNTKVTTTFSKPVRTRYIRIYPQTWNQHMSMRADMFAADTNTNNLSALGDLPYKNHSSSANWGGDKIGVSHGAGRLDSERSWSAKENKNTEWYELRSGSSPINITGVAMKGRPDHPQWITSVKIQYDSGDGMKDIDDGFIFDANYDQHSLVKIFFEKPVKTNSIRIYPQSWIGHASGRFGILRGDDSLKIPDESPPPSGGGFLGGLFGGGDEKYSIF